MARREYPVLINALSLDRDGSLWLGTESGLTHFTPNQGPPRVRLTRVLTDRSHTDPAAVPSVLAGTPVTFEYAAIDFETLPGPSVPTRPRAPSWPT